MNVAALTLIGSGGVLYLVGRAVYAPRRPNPSPTWFGFHAVFRLCTVLGFTAHCIAMSIVTFNA